jgi:thiopurine S-methyltransferase
MKTFSSLFSSLKNMRAKISIEKQIEVNQFWKNVWITRESHGELPNFHDNKVKHFLKEYLSTHSKEKLDTVLVPFCGKSIDMLWLMQQGYNVRGVDLSEEATNSFFRENKLTFERKEDGAFIIKQATNLTGSLTILCGDLFKLQPKHLQDIDLVYDRAGYNSIPLELRQKYAMLLARHLPKEVKILLGVLDFEGQEPKSGPPYFISEEELLPLTSKFDVMVYLEKRADYFLNIAKQIEQKPNHSSKDEGVELQKSAVTEQQVDKVNVLTEITNSFHNSSTVDPANEVNAAGRISIVEEVNQ